MLNQNIDRPAMVAGYLECVLWSATGDDGEPLDSLHSPTDITDTSQNAARVDCALFVAACTEAGIDLEALPLGSSAIGHDLWLTRNRHGAGFWDRGLGAVGQQLTEHAHLLGSVDAYAGDDGLVYLS